MNFGEELEYLYSLEKENKKLKEQIKILMKEKNNLLRILVNKRKEIK